MITFRCRVFLFALVSALIASGKVPAEGWQQDLLMVLEYVPMYTLTTRFIMGIREFHARDIQGRCGEGIDSGFGLSSSGQSAGGTAIMFADVERNERPEDIEEVPREVVTT